PAPSKTPLAGFIPLSPTLLGTGCPTIVSRSQWGARPPRSRVQLRTPVPFVIIHHTAGNRCTSLASCRQQVKGIQNYHMDNQRWSDIGYNFLIGEDGRVYEGRGWRTVGAHARGWNAKSLGFSFLGNFSSTWVPSIWLSPAKPSSEKSYESLLQALTCAVVGKPPGAGCIWFRSPALLRPGLCAWKCSKVGDLKWPRRPQLPGVTRGTAGHSDAPGTAHSCSPSTAGVTS
uniref:Ig-like domain-containing protein n=1 Tax=Pelusios castaneus TaxID=367368 RepID=A0A8C8SM59_9SAUR